MTVNNYATHEKTEIALEGPKLNRNPDQARESAPRYNDIDQEIAMKPGFSAILSVSSYWAGARSRR